MNEYPIILWKNEFTLTRMGFRRRGDVDWVYDVVAAVAAAIGDIAAAVHKTVCDIAFGLREAADVLARFARAADKTIAARRRLQKKCLYRKYDWHYRKRHIGRRR